MADNELINRIKAEGHLTRNSGTNSIKRVIAGIDKFTDIMTEINQHMLDQTLLLQAMVTNQELVAQLEQQRRDLETLNVPPPVPVPPAPIILPNGNQGNPNDPDIQGQSTLDNILTGAVAGLAAAVSMYALRKLGTIGLIAFLAPVIGGWVADFTEASLSHANFAAAFSSSMGDAAGSAALGFLIGSIVNKRLGVIFASAAFTQSFADEIVNSMGLDGDAVVGSIFGNELMLEDAIAGILGALGIGIVAYLSSAAFRASVGALIAGTAFAAQFSMLRFGIAGAVIGAYLLFGDEAKRVLEELGVPDDFANIAVDTVGIIGGAVTLGAMFGPKGMIAGAAIGVALSLGKAIYDWMNNETNKAMKEVDDVLSSATKEDMDTFAATGSIPGLETDDTSEFFINRKVDQALAANTKLDKSAVEFDEEGSVIINDEALSRKSDVLLFNGSRTSDEVKKSLFDELDNARYQLDHQLKLEQDKDIKDLQLIERYQVMLDTLESTLRSARQSEPLGFFDKPTTPSMSLNITPEIIEPMSFTPPSTFDTNSVLSEKVKQLMSQSESASASIMFAPMTNSPVTNVHNGGNSSITNVVSNIGAFTDLDKPLFA